MSHSPLRMFKKFHDKCVLVSGQGPALEIAKKYPGILVLYVSNTLFFKKLYLDITMYFSLTHCL